MGRLIAWLFDAIVLFLIVRMVLRLLGSGRPAARSGSSRPSSERAGGTLVRDPQCGTYVPQSRAFRAGTGADAVYFCSTACRDAYQSARTANPAASGPSARSESPRGGA